MGGRQRLLSLRTPSTASRKQSIEISESRPRNDRSLTPPRSRSIMKRHDKFASRSPRKSRNEVVPIAGSSSGNLGRQGMPPGPMVRGPDFENYCRKRGLCHICGVTQTHEPNKTLFTTKLKPLTQRDKNGEYIVYKGYCVEPTCYTLEEAKTLLWEKMDGIIDHMIEYRRSNQFKFGLFKRGKSCSDLGISDDNGRPGRTPENMGKSKSFHSNRSQANRSTPSTTGRLSLLSAPPSQSRAARHANLKSCNSDKTILEIRKKALTLLDVEVLVKTQLHGVRTLIMDCCDLGDVGTQALCNFMIDFPPASLRVLCLRQNRIGLGGSEAIAQLLESSATDLTKIRLSHNQIGNEGCRLIFNALEQSSYVAEVSLGFNHIGYDGAVHIGRCLEINSSLRYLSLDHNTLGNEGTLAVCRGMINNSYCGIETLILRSNGISDVGASVVAELLVNSANFVVDIHGNRVGDDGALQLLKALLECPNTSSRVFGIEGNEVTDISLLDQIIEMVEEKMSEEFYPEFEAPQVEPLQPIPNEWEESKFEPTYVQPRQPRQPRHERHEPRRPVPTTKLRQAVDDEPSTVEMPESQPTEIVRRGREMRPMTPPRSDYIHETRRMTPPRSDYRHETRPMTPPRSDYTHERRPMTPPRSEYRHETRPMTPPRSDYMHETRPMTPPRQESRPMTPPRHETRPMTPPSSDYEHGTRIRTPPRSDSIDETHSKVPSLGETRPRTPPRSDSLGETQSQIPSLDETQSKVPSLGETRPRTPPRSDSASPRQPAADAKTPPRSCVEPKHSAPARLPSWSSSSRQLYPTLSSQELPESADVSALLKSRNSEDSQNRGGDTMYPSVLDEGLPNPQGKTAEQIENRANDRNKEAPKSAESIASIASVQDRNAENNQNRVIDTYHDQSLSNDEQDQLRAAVERSMMDEGITSLIGDQFPGAEISHSHSYGSEQARSQSSRPEQPPVQPYYINVHDESSYQALQGIFNNPQDLEAFLGSA